MNLKLNSKLFIMKYAKFMEMMKFQIGKFETVLGSLIMA